MMTSNGGDTNNAASYLHIPPRIIIILVLALSLTTSLWNSIRVNVSFLQLQTYYELTTTREKVSMNSAMKDDNDDDDENNNVKNETTTILLMSDSRSLFDIDDYHKLAYTINSYYAKIHNYHIKFFHTPCIQNAEENAKDKPKQCIACSHPIYGGRMSPWCKIKSINATMHQYSDSKRIVYIDSDAFVNHIDQPFKERYFDSTLNMFANKNDAVPCSGIQMWQNTPLSRKMIQAWWDSNTGTYNTNHDYEQSVFHTNSTLLQQFGNEIGIIRESVREYNRLPKKDGGFFRHITKKTNNTRHVRMKEFIQKHNISMDLHVNKVDFVQLVPNE